MQWVVFYASSTVEKKSYNRYHDAVRYADKLNDIAKSRGWKDEFVVYHRDFYQNYVVHQETVRNAMTGKPVVQWSNTPYALSVASDHYWQS